MNEVPKQIRIQIVQQELQMWRNTAWQLEMRHRVTKRVGGDVKAITDDLVKAEGAIAELEAMLKEIEMEAQPAPQSGAQ